MDIKRTLRFAILVGLVLLAAVALTACKQPSKNAPATTTTTDQAGAQVQPGAEPTDQSMGIFDALATPTTAPAPVLVVAATATPETTVVEQPTAAPLPQATDAPAAIPVAPAVVVAIPTTGPLPPSYTLQKGEHPFCIARRFNVNQSELLAINGLTLNSKPAAGAVLKIPQTGNPFVTERALKAHPAQYTVTGNDTIYTIACAFGDVSPEMIALANGLSAPYTLTAGQALSIP